MSYIDDEGYQRNATGQFNTTDVGADPFSQASAGVNQFDSRIDAQRKVSEFAHAEVMREREREYAQHGGRYVPERPSIAGRVLLIIIFFFGVGIALLSIPNYLRYPWPHDDVYASGNFKYINESQVDFQQRQAQHLESMSSAGSIFLPDAPLKKIFEGCKKPCAGPDLHAFDNFRKYAENKDVAAYENNICRTFFGAGSTTSFRTLNTEAKYKFDRTERTCVLANVEEIRSLLRSNNSNPIVRYWKHAIWFLAFLLSVYLIKRLLTYQTRRLIETGWKK